MTVTAPRFLLVLLYACYLVQVGLRGYTTVDQYQEGRRLGIRRISATRFSEVGAQAAAEQALQQAPGGWSRIDTKTDEWIYRRALGQL